MAPPRPVDDLDDDDFDDGYDDDFGGEEEEMSAEDQVAMSNGTAEVRKALGPNASKVTVKQIQDALWNSWYDVDKSVASLRKTYITPASKPAPKKPTQGMSPAFSFPAALETGGEDCGGTSGADPWHVGGMNPISSTTTTPVLSYILGQPPVIKRSFDFSDMPWLKVPQNRQANLVAPQRPRGGLLGGGDGTPKMSKLQALAAARKKKTEEKKSQDTLQTTKGLQDLSISEDNRQENDPSGSGSSKRQKLSAEPSSSSLKPAMRLQSQTLDGVAEEEQPPHNETRTGVAPEPSPGHSNLLPSEEDDVQMETGMTAPSAFATTLFGSAPESSHAHRPDLYAMPYTSSSSFSASAFSKPSPDDIVFAAQAQGSSFSKTN
jgi:elongation factor 1 alpha-like protein